MTLREYRELRGMTQEELARRANVAVRTVGGIEAGRAASMAVRRKIMAALYVPLRRHREVFGPLRFDRGLPDA
jgi:transcriptional regulator with XRE-family HTH domain